MDSAAAAALTPSLVTPEGPSEPVAVASAPPPAPAELRQAVQARAAAVPPAALPVRPTDQPPHAVPLPEYEGPMFVLPTLGDEDQGEP